MNLIVGTKLYKTIILIWKDHFFCIDKANIYSTNLHHKCIYS